MLSGFCKKQIRGNPCRSHPDRGWLHSPVCSPAAGQNRPRGSTSSPATFRAGQRSLQLLYRDLYQSIGCDIRRKAAPVKRWRRISKACFPSSQLTGPSACGRPPASMGSSQAPAGSFWRPSCRLSLLYLKAEGAGFQPSAGKCGGNGGAIQFAAKRYLQKVLHMAAAAKAVGNRQRFFRLRQAIASVRRLLLHIKTRDYFSVRLQCDAAYVIGSIGGFDSFFQRSVLRCNCFRRL